MVIASKNAPQEVKETAPAPAKTHGIKRKAKHSSIPKIKKEKAAEEVEQEEEKVEVAHEQVSKGLPAEPSKDEGTI
jgi:hypothetical protein